VTAANGGGALERGLKPKVTPLPENAPKNLGEGGVELEQAELEKRENKFSKRGKAPEDSEAVREPVRCQADATGRVDGKRKSGIRGEKDGELRGRPEGLLPKGGRTKGCGTPPRQAMGTAPT